MKEIALSKQANAPSPDLAAAPGGESARFTFRDATGTVWYCVTPSPTPAAAPGGGRRRFIVEVDEQTTMAQVRDHLDMIDQGGASVWYAPAAPPPDAGLVALLREISEECPSELTVPDKHRGSVDADDYDVFEVRLDAGLIRRLRAALSRAGERHD